MTAKQPPMIAITVLYKSDIPMNQEYYLTSHCPMVDQRLSSHGLRRSEVRKIGGTAAGAPAPYQIVTTLYFDDLAAFGAAFNSEDGQFVRNDIANFYEGAPDILIGDVAYG